MTVEEYLRKYDTCNFCRDLFWPEDIDIRKYKDHLVQQSLKLPLYMTKLSGVESPRIDFRMSGMLRFFGYLPKQINLSVDRFELIDRKRNVVSFNSLCATILATKNGEEFPLSIYSRHEINEDIHPIPSTAEDIVAQITIGNDGYPFSPVLISCIHNEKEITPHGRRIDWDVLENNTRKILWNHECKKYRSVDYSSRELYDLRADAFGDNLDDDYVNPYD